ncbi:MAG: hypothetical protein J5802_05100 [Butyrivibrio sp.]|nr:hypothetical protein [Butyrivibrio sp.]
MKVCNRCVAMMENKTEVCPNCRKRVDGTERKIVAVCHHEVDYKTKISMKWTYISSRFESSYAAC